MTRGMTLILILIHSILFLDGDLSDATSCWIYISQLIRFARASNKISDFPVSIFYQSTAGSYRPVRVADGPITARCRLIKNASWV